MKRKIIAAILSSVIACTVIGCGAKDAAGQESEQILTETSEWGTETEMEIETESEIETDAEPGTESEDSFVEPEGRITSGPGAVYDGKLYYAVAQGGCHTGIRERDLVTGEEAEVVSNEGTNGFSYLSVYDGYLYCVWNKYTGTDSEDYQIYRFSLEDFSGKHIANGCMPIVANRTLYYWKFKWNSNGDSQTATLYQCDIDTLDKSKAGVFAGTVSGFTEEYSYEGIYDYYYLDGEIYVGIAYEGLGKYDESTGLYELDGSEEKGVIVYDMDGNEADPSEYGIEYSSYDSDGSPYGVDCVYQKSEIVGDGRMVVGISGENEVLNYIDPDGNITTLQTWMPAE